MMITTCGCLLVGCAALALSLFGCLLYGAWHTRRQPPAASPRATHP